MKAVQNGGPQRGTSADEEVVGRLSLPGNRVGGRCDT